MIRKDRHLYIPLSFSTTVEKYYTMFGHPNIGREKSIKKIVDDNCKHSLTSFIMTSYYIYVLKGYNKQFKSIKIDDIITKYQKIISENKKNMITNDDNLLGLYKHINIPDISSILEDSKRILSIRIDSKKLISQKNQVLKLVIRFSENVNTFSDLLPYLQFLYTIRELKLEDIYESFITSFLSSSQYKLYDQYYITVSKTVRWIFTLLYILKIEI